MSTSRGTTVAFSTFSSIFDAASKEYKKKTGQDLQAHPLAAELDHCDSPDAILKVLQKQADALDDSDQPLMKWLSPTVNLLFLFSAALGEGLTLVSFSKLVFPVSPFINILFSAIPRRKGNIYRNWRPSRGKFLLGFLFAYTYDTISFRLLRTSQQVMMSSSIFSSASRHSSRVSIFIPGFRSPPK